MATKRRATIADLYRVPESAKAEIVNGRLVQMPPTGDVPNRAAGAIYVSLRLSERSVDNIHRGRAYTNNAVFKVKLPNRQSFSPDAAFYIGEHTGMRFLEGA